MNPQHAKSPTLPREHGAWAMLLQPFVGSLIAMKAFAWPVIPAFACIMLTFLVREPLMVLARQKWVWRNQHPETAEARKQLALYLAGILAGSIFLLGAWPPKALLGLGGIAGALTVLAVSMTVHNRQREVWLQAISAAGLASSGIAACLSVIGAIPGWAWTWWALHAAHFLTSILVVHVRLQAKIDARIAPTGIQSVALRGLSNQARFIQGLVAIAGLALLSYGQLYYGFALLISSAVHFREIASASTEKAIHMPMTTVGKRALVVSIVFTALLVAAVWTA